MKPISATEPIVKQTLTEWFGASGELVIELDVPHSGGSGDFYVLNFYAQFEDLILKARPNAIAFVLRDKHFPVRGIVDDALISLSFEKIFDEEYYLIVEPPKFPQRLSFVGDGNTHVELKNDLEKLRGQEVWLGREPEFPNSYVEQHLENALVICKPKEIK